MHGASHETITIGMWVAYLEDENAQHYHIGKIASMGDDVRIDTYATTAPRLATAKWQPLEQIVRTEEYTLAPSAVRNQVQVQDIIPQEAANELIIATKLQLLPSGAIAAKSRKVLQALHKRHHRLNTTFP